MGTQIGERVKRYRRLSGLTQQQLGERCKPSMHGSAIRRIENGDNRPHSLTLDRLAEALNIPTRWLIEDDAWFTDERCAIVIDDIKKRKNELADLEARLDRLDHRQMDPFEKDMESEELQNSIRIETAELSNILANPQKYVINAMATQGNTIHGDIRQYLDSDSFDALNALLRRQGKVYYELDPLDEYDLIIDPSYTYAVTKEDIEMLETSTNAFFSQILQVVLNRSQSEKTADESMHLLDDLYSYHKERRYTKVDDTDGKED